MIVCDSITSADLMSKRGIVVSIAKTRNQCPFEVFTRLARSAAHQASRDLGARIAFHDNALFLEEESIAVDLVLSGFRKALLATAKREAGLY